MNSERYIRQTTLQGFGEAGQRALRSSGVLVVGAGGLGVPVLLYLNSMGVGAIGIVEGDTIEKSNLARQILYDEDQHGMSKIKVAVEKLKKQNSDTKFHLFDTFLTVENAIDILTPYDLIIDCSDNFATRYLVNDACVILNKPFVYGALHGFEGQVSVFNYQNGPTYRCLFPEMPSAGEIPDCNENGVLGVLPGIVGTLQALEAVKVLTGIGEVLSGKLLVFDGWNQESRKIAFETVPANKSISRLESGYEPALCMSLQSLHPEDLKELIDSGKDFQCIDVRTPEEYARFHLEESTNIPLADLPLRVKELRLDHPLYLLCESGVRSQKAARFLFEKAPNALIFELSGGLAAYRKFTVEI